MSRNTLFKVILGTIGACIVASTAAYVIDSQMPSGWLIQSPARRAPENAVSCCSVVYKVTSTADWKFASLTYENSQGGTEQVDTHLPWEKSFSFDRGDFAYVSAQTHSNGGITCEIWVNGKLWKTSTSSGKYVIADCSGLVGE